MELVPVPSRKGILKTMISHWMFHLFLEFALIFMILEINAYRKNQFKKASKYAKWARILLSAAVGFLLATLITLIFFK